MKRLILILFFCFCFVQGAIAAPFLASDPQASAVGLGFEVWENVKGLAEHMIVLSGTMIVSAENKPDGSIWYDMKDVPPGEHFWYVRYFQNWGFYGAEKIEAGGKTYSVFVPFEFTKRSPVVVFTKGLRLVPQ
jgi:hypothetical protein